MDRPTSFAPIPRGRLTAWLENAPAPLFTAFVIFASFSTYFCMYAFRKPFSAASYEGLKFLGGDIDLKTAFVISQIIGYALSKVIGIKVCAEIDRQKRARGLVLMIVVAELSLLLFAVLPNNLKVIAIFFNGLPLGMVWGLVVLYLEGRRTSEMLLAGLSCAYIVASGAVKDIGLWLMSTVQVDQFWMPCATGICFLPPFVGSVWLLNQLPQPDADDIAARVERTTMGGSQRWQFFRQFLPEMLLLSTVYFFLTAYRDFRDNFGKELFESLGGLGLPVEVIQTSLDPGIERVDGGVQTGVGLLLLAGELGAFGLIDQTAQFSHGRITLLESPRDVLRVHRNTPCGVDGWGGDGLRPVTEWPMSAGRWSACRAAPVRLRSQG